MIWIFRFLIILGIVYNGFAWYTEIKSEKDGNIVFKKVLFRDCNVNIGTAIKVYNNGVEQRVEIPYVKCKNILEGDKIKLVYNKAFKSYHFPENRSSRNILIFFIIVFILSFINFQELRDKLNLDN